MKTTFLFALALQGCAAEGGHPVGREVESTPTEEATVLPDAVPASGEFSEPLEIETKKTEVAPQRHARPAYVKRDSPKLPSEQPAVVEEPAVMKPPRPEVATVPATAPSEVPTAKRYAPDNTGRNRDYRSDEILTPFDQSSDRGDIDITVAVRKGVLRHSGVSIYGRNVKIITRGGIVTLRGPVANVDERAWITELARGVSGVLRVDDQITVMSH